MKLASQYTISQQQLGLSARRPLWAQRVYGLHGHEIVHHDHEYIELTLVTAGTAVHTTEKGDAPVRRGSVTVVAPGMVHGFSQLDGFEAITLYYLSQWLIDDPRQLWGSNGVSAVFWSTALFDARSSRHAIPQFELVDEILDLCIAECDEMLMTLQDVRPPLDRLRAGLLRLMAVMSYCPGTEPAQESILTFRKPVGATLEWIEHCLATGTPFRVAKLASDLSMSSDHLCRVFRHEVGETPRSYFQRRRAMMAGRLLLDPSRSVNEVAEAMGYCDAAHFCNVFKRTEGLSPGAFRSKYLRTTRWF